MTGGRTICGLCGKDPAEGYAAINDVRYCHGDGPVPSCYELAMIGPGWRHREIEL